MCVSPPDPVPDTVEGAVWHRAATAAAMDELAYPAFVSTCRMSMCPYTALYLLDSLRSSSSNSEQMIFNLPAVISCWYVV